MTASDRRVLPLILLVLLCSGAALFWFQGEADQDELHAAEESDPASPIRISRAQVPSLDAPSNRLFDRHKTELEESPDTPLVFDDSIASGKARAVFRVVDRLHQPLDRGVSFVGRLFRKVGEYWQREHVHHDEENGEIICAGFVGTGLEAGDYELRVSSGVYGNINKSFSLAKGEVLRGFVALPHWKRRIRLRYVSADGEPLELIHTEPRYYPPRTHEIRQNERTPKTVLADPPALEGEWISWEDEFFINEPHRPYLPFVGNSYLTRDGFWELDVYAGAEGWLIQGAMPGSPVQSILNLSSDFTEPKWENFEVRLPLTEKDKLTLENALVVNSKTPGSTRKSEYSAPDPADEDSVNSNVHRLIFSHNYPGKLDLHAYQSDKKHNAIRVAISSDSIEPVESEDNVAKRQAGVDFVDLFHGDGTWAKYWYNDGALLRTDEFAHDVGQLMQTQKVSRVKTDISSQPFSFKVGLPTPTSQAWARGIRVSWKHDQNRLVKQRMNVVDSDEFHVDTALVGQTSEPTIPKQEIAVLVQGESINPNYVLMGRLAKSGRDGQSAAGYRVDINPEGLIARAVDEDGTGLPWVEAALIEMDDIRESMSIRTRQRNWRRQKRADRHYSNDASEIPVRIDDTENLARDIISDLDEEPNDHSNAVIQKMLPPDLYAELGSHKERQLFLKNYTWYDTYHRLYSDSRGYIHNWNDNKLKAGKRYVLFLWSRSRDHLVPDKAVVFTMSEGLKDLGAIQMPGYR